MINNTSIGSVLFGTDSQTLGFGLCLEAENGECFLWTLSSILKKIIVVFWIIH